MSDLFATQWRILQRDRWLLSCLTWIPLILVVSIWAIFSQGIARDLPIGVVDLSHSQLSRQLSRNYDATATLSVTHHFSDVAEAKQALVSSQVYAYVVIPDNFDKDIYRGLPPEVSAFYNSQTILIGKLIGSALVQAQATFNAHIDASKALAKGNSTVGSAVGTALPVQTQITPLFNKNANYAQFLVSAIVPALWQIIIVVSTILVLTANHRDRGLTQWFKSAPTMQWTRTLLPYFPVFMVQGFTFLCWFYLGFDWPMNGSLLVLMFAQGLTVMACMIMGSFFFFLTLDPARAMSFAGAFTAPSFAFMGITFPVTDMNPLAQFWRSLLPISHYIEAQVSQVSYGQFWVNTALGLLPMSGYLLPALISVLLIKKHLSRHNSLYSQEAK
ncbi:MULTISPECIES: ABC transporter permease [Vibrio]|uniref:ABC transporter permease n=1 Tax=Vibrio TaxID=662 RepID=UPI0001B9527B|nr:MULTISPECIES: ABC transporter permease [Vibrio]EEX30960.1 ABC-type multidrug transport system permease component [Vibrio coralliilyticus ATCC BAA-450]MCM5507424.1 ABC transporter permease [Vibrio sp. SCSIO 43169]MDE3896161.1 ABC transporter permease [Vibrio sp. CC007]QFT36282.1 ABC-2 family transporter protein [Vibrio sp. THAF64]QGM34182.1 ABC-2 family transporter protein [Vibrio sp. THAF191d]